MDRAGRERVEDAVFAEHHLLDRAIVGEHGDDHLAARGIARRLGELRALADERLGLGGRCGYRR